MRACFHSFRAPFAADEAVAGQNKLRVLNVSASRIFVLGNCFPAGCQRNTFTSVSTSRHGRPVPTDEAVQAVYRVSPASSSDYWLERTVDNRKAAYDTFGVNR